MARTYPRGDLGHQDPGNRNTAEVSNGGTAGLEGTAGVELHLLQLSVTSPTRTNTPCSVLPGVKSGAHLPV